MEEMKKKKKLKENALKQIHYFVGITTQSNGKRR